VKTNSVWLCALGVCGAWVVAAAARQPSDAEGIVRGLESPLLRRQWQDKEMAWARRIQKCRARPECVARVIGDRRATIATLSARIGPFNPILEDLDAIVLRGQWTASPLQRIDGRRPSYPIFNSLPFAGAKVTGHPGAVCYDGKCKSLGFEQSVPLPARAAREAASLGLKPGMVGWLALNSGKAEWVVYPVGKALVILADGCLRPYDYSDCAPGFIVLTPQSADAALQRL
jgi:hypothetical protein